MNMIDFAESFSHGHAPASFLQTEDQRESMYGKLPYRCVAIQKTLWIGNESSKIWIRPEVTIPVALLLSSRGGSTHRIIF